MRIYTPAGLIKPPIFYTFAISVSDAPAASVNDYAPAGFGAGTNRLRITPFAGGTTLTGLSANLITDGASIVVFNESATDVLRFTNSDAASLAANRFLTPGTDPFSLIPQDGVLLVRVGSNWRFL